MAVCRGCSGELPVGRRRFCNEDCKPRCSFDGCTNPRQRVYCATHAMQLARTGTVSEIRRWTSERKCVVCGQVPPPEMNRRTACSQKCQQLAHRNGGEAPAKYRNCVRCQTVIDMTALGKCGRKRRSDVKVCDHCRRARGTRHKVSIGTLLQRDGNSCGICSGPIDMKLVSPDMQRASVDHILPYSKGGTHDLGNLQLAHLYCNCIKNAREGFVIER